MSMFRNIYLSIFGLKRFRKINDQILSFALHARGFNNFSSFELSGEKFFVDNILSRLNPEICVDVGANVGNYSSLLLEKTNAKIFSFEPLVGPYKQLIEACKQFEDRITAVNKGIGEKNETLTIYFNNDATAHASFSEDV